MRRMADSTPAFDEAHAAFIQSGVSVHVASRDAANVPSVGRGFGCRVATDRSRVTVFLSMAQTPDVVRDLRASKRVAAVFSQPSTHRTIQIKGDDATIGTLEDGDLARIAAYADALVRDLQKLGFSEAVGRTLVHCRPADLVAVAFTPKAAFRQTPGPNAGAPLER